MAILFEDDTGTIRRRYGNDWDDTSVFGVTNKLVLPLIIKAFFRTV